MSTHKTWNLYSKYYNHSTKLDQKIITFITFGIVVHL